MSATLRQTNQRSGLLVSLPISSITYSSASIGATLVGSRPSQELYFAKQ
jgi:hypothetical protein